MEKIVEQTLLYDFYGELLTDRQKEIYEEIVFNDLSLSEAAEEYGISRQGIHDMLKRSENALRDYESKLHMVERTRKVKELASRILSAKDGEEARDLARSILKVLGDEPL